LKTALVINDLHLPYIDKPLWNLLCEFCKTLKPDVRVWNGDLFDFYQASRFDKTASRKDTMSNERDVSIKYIMQMTEAYSTHDIALPGNHEARLVKYLDRNSDIALNLGVYDTTWHSFLCLEDFDFEIHDFNGVGLPVIELGHLKIYHGDRINKHSVVNIANDWGCSVLYGHTHRLRSFFKTVYTTTHGVWENGYLANPKLSQQYMAGLADWQQGFAVVTHDEKTGWFQVAQVPVCRVEGKDIKRFMYRGEIYECKA